MTLLDRIMKRIEPMLAPAIQSSVRDAINVELAQEPQTAPATQTDKLSIGGVTYPPYVYPDAHTQATQAIVPQTDEAVVEEMRYVMAESCFLRTGEKWYSAENEALKKDLHKALPVVRRGWVPAEGMVSLSAVKEAIRGMILQCVTGYEDKIKAYLEVFQERLARLTAPKPKPDAAVEAALDVFESQGYARADVARFAEAIVAAVRAADAAKEAADATHVD